MVSKSSVVVLISVSVFGLGGGFDGPAVFLQHVLKYFRTCYSCQSFAAGGCG